jgi:acetaldehyde dehydrogenase/alcohol dehydrogenase
MTIRAISVNGRSWRKADTARRNISMNRLIGQDAQTIASFTGIERSYPVKLIVVPVSIDEVERKSPFAREKLAPLLSLFAVDGEADAFALCRGILAAQGAGHTAIVHTRSSERAGRFGLAMPAGRILVNLPAVQGICGIATGLVPSYTLGCGTFGGNSTTDNVSYRNLQNIKRLAHAVALAPGARDAMRQPPSP